MLGVLFHLLVTRLALAQLRLHAELLDLARKRIAAPPKPRRGFHAVTTRVRERAPDQRALEILFQAITDVALAACERLHQLAIERLLPADFAFAGARRTRHLASLR